MLRGIVVALLKSCLESDGLPWYVLGQIYLESLYLGYAASIKELSHAQYREENLYFNSEGVSTEVGNNLRGAT